MIHTCTRQPKNYTIPFFCIFNATISAIFSQIQMTFDKMNIHRFSLTPPHSLPHHHSFCIYNSYRHFSSYQISFYVMFMRWIFPLLNCYILIYSFFFLFIIGFYYYYEALFFSKINCLQLKTKVWGRAGEWWHQIKISNSCQFKYYTMAILNDRCIIGTVPDFSTENLWFLSAIRLGNLVV